MSRSNINKEVARQGLVPGVIATLCCLGPVLLIMLGLISASTGMAITTYATYFIPAGVIILTASLWYAVRRRRALICYGCQDKDQERKRIISFVVLSVAIAVVTYLLVFYVVLPKLAPVILDNFGGR